jgi:hypothetical protein
MELMRKLLPCLLAMLLFSLMLLGAAASAHAVSLPVVGQPALPAASAADDDEAGDDEGEGDEGESEAGDDDGESEDCAAGEGEEEACEEEGDGAEAEECLLEEANASVVAVPGQSLVHLSVHYRASEPTAVNVDAGLHGGKGSLHLGSERVRFHRAGLYRKSFRLGPKQMPKALAARQFVIDLRAVGAPADCELQLATRGSRRAK